MPESGNNVKWYYIVAPIGCLVFILIILLAIKMNKRRRPDTSIRHQSSPIYIVPERESNTVTVATDFLRRQPVYKNQDVPEYLVPYSALPYDFDFSARDIKVFGDYVILKDLKMLETRQKIENLSYMEAYEKQQPYNPDYYQRY